MDLTFYRILLEQISDTPDLSIVQQCQPVPEGWPVVLSGFEFHRRKIQAFQITDGTHTVTCRAPLAEMYDKIGVMEPGTIVHLIGSEVQFDSAKKCYTLLIQDVYTLKEYDDHIKKRQAETARRLDQMKREGFFEQFQNMESAENFPRVSTKERRTTGRRELVNATAY